MPDIYNGLTAKQIEQYSELRSLGGLTSKEEDVLAEAQAQFDRASTEQVSPGGAESIIGSRSPTELSALPEEVVPTEIPRIPGELVGGITGGFVGGAATGGNPLGMIIGAGIGGGLGEAAEQTINQLLSGEALTLEDSAKRVVKSMGTQAGGEAVGVGAAASLGKALAPAAKRVLPETQEAAEMFAREAGGKFTAAQMSEIRGIDLIENIAEASLFGGGRITRFKETQLGKAQGLLENILEEFGAKATPEQTGDLILRAIREETSLSPRTGRLVLGEESTIFGDVSSALFSKVDEAIGAEPSVSTEAIKKSIQSSEDFMTGGAGKQVIESRVRSFMNGLRKLPDTVSFQGLQKQRALIGEFLATKDLSKTSRRGLSQIIESINNEMKLAAERAGPDIFGQYQKANRFHAAGSKRFRNKIIQRLLKKNPEDIANRLFQRGDVTDIRMVRKIVGQKDWGKVQGQFFRQMVERSLDNGVPNGQRILNNMERMTEPTLKEIFPFELDKAKLKKFRTAANIIKTSESRQAEGTGRMLIQLTQGGALVNVVAGSRGKGASMLVLFGPPGLARLMTSDLGIKWLGMGFRPAGGMKELLATTGQVVGFLAKEGLGGDAEPGRERTKEPVVPLPSELQTPAPPRPKPAPPTAVSGIRG